MSEGFRVKSRFKDYEVVFTNEFVETLSRQHNENSFFLVDAELAELYRDKMSLVLHEERFFPIAANEHNKTLDFCGSLIKELVEKGIRKNSMIVAVGGGVIQDIAAFISSILYRGVEWTCYPTTLLAQADSCIGSKTSINLGNFKNLVGNFYPPSRIYIDIGFLETLPAVEIKSGIGEMLHYYFIAGSEKARLLMAGYDEFVKAPRMLRDFISASLDIKKKVVEADEFDRNERNLFNYGHTFGHAIETVSGYAVNHGQAVTMGMDIANFISLDQDFLKREDFDLMHTILERNLPEFSLDESSIDNYLKALSRDKKNIGKELGCILSRGPGAMIKVQLPIDKRLMKIILAYFDLPSYQAQV